MTEQEELLQAIYVTNARCYDVLIALLKEQNKAAAYDMLQRHNRGEILTPVPKYVGKHLFDE